MDENLFFLAQYRVWAAQSGLVVRTIGVVIK